MKKEQLDPRQAKFLELYLDPQSETFGNAYQSGIKAGYSKEYSENIMSLLPDWLSENIEGAELVAQALKNLKEFLKGKDRKIRADMTKFTLERLNKKKFSSKTEIEHSGSVEEIQKVDDKQKELISNFNLWIKQKIKK